MGKKGNVMLNIFCSSKLGKRECVLEESKFGLIIERRFKK
jgi:hypothetical protein